MKKMYFNLLTIVCLLFWLVAKTQTNYALNFKVSEYCTIDNTNTSSNELKPTTSFTLNAWVKPSKTSGQQDINSARADVGSFASYHLILKEDCLKVLYPTLFSLC